MSMGGRKEHVSYLFMDWSMIRRATIPSKTAIEKAEMLKKGG